MVNTKSVPLGQAWEIFRFSKVGTGVSKNYTLTCHRRNGKYKNALLSETMSGIFLNFRSEKQSEGVTTCH
jgi:hypothetical protein